ncbi:hypothetical protein OGAPHI_003961 [Ogataea philodendri]|uniref:PCI domain-containing protein n=1 Tax=Ogataea philodendri TaxID=1378263 RepID=A0A9P8P5A8_9ASCO|nr:uncharacterized protein OGAPHI_003961 [Ogataea philodendri]KAH3665773.1 hypothetical protein OGAPHI_003961 [Ogataea philodendri]
MFTIVSERFVGECAVEYAAALDLELKTEYKASFEALADQENKQELLTKVLESSQDLAKLSDTAFEPTFNLLLHLIDILRSELDVSLEQQLEPVLTQLQKIPVVPDDVLSKERSQIRVSSLVSALSNLFNFIPSQSSLRVAVLKTIISTVSTHSLSNVAGPLAQYLKVWLLECGASSSDVQEIYLQTIELLFKDQKDSQAVQLFKELVQISNSSLSSSEYSRFLVLCFNSPAYIGLDSINFEPLQQDPVLYSLLSTYKDSNLQEYASLSKSLSSYNIDSENLSNKLKLAAVTRIASKKSQLSYTEISNELHVPLDQVEEFLIKCIKSGLISGRLDQDKELFYIHKVSKLNSVSKEDWEFISTKLSGWSAQITHLQTVIESTQSRKGKRVPPPQVLQKFYQQKQELKEQLQQEREKEAQ